MHLGRRNVLSSELENKLLEYCIIMDQRYYGLRPQDIKCMTFHLAIRNGVKHSFNQEESEAGKILFTKSSSNIYENSWRHFCSSGERLYIRKRSKVFFSTCESELRKVNHPVHRIFSVDETVITTGRNRNSKVVSMRSKKEVASLTSVVLSLVWMPLEHLTFHH